MLNFRLVNIVFAVLMLSLISWYLISPINLLYFVALLSLYSGIVFYGSFFVGSGFYMKVVCSGNTDEKKIAITFDDGPLREITPHILNLLKKRNVKATFFCIGSRIEENEDLLRRMHNEGHIIANHTWSHSKWIDLYSTKQMVKEISLTSAAIEDAIDLKPRFFRPPYGVTNPSIKKAVEKKLNLAIGWNVRSLDTKLNDSEQKILSRVVGKLQPGCIVLFHDVNPKIVAILQEFFDYLDKNGYKIVALDELINAKAYE